MVTVSSTTRQRRPGSTGPSTQRCSPCSLRSPRTKKATQLLAGGHRDRRAGRRDRRGRRTADRLGPDLGGGRGDQLAGGAEAGRPHQRPPRVDVVLGRRAARQRHLAEDQRVLAQLREQRPLGGVEVGHGGILGRSLRQAAQRAIGGSPGASSGAPAASPARAWPWRWRRRAGPTAERGDVLAGDEPGEPDGDPARRLGAERLGVDRQPLAQRRRLVVDDVVDAGSAALERGDGRAAASSTWTKEKVPVPLPTIGQPPLLTSSAC